MTGCGATSLAIEQEGSTILTVPYIGLIENKKKKYGDLLLDIYGEGDKTDQIADYLTRFPQYKIAVTYNSLQKVCRSLESLGRNPYKEAFLAVDEWHVLCQHYSFRYNAVRDVLDEAPKFERKTYISATPLERKYWLEELRDHPEIVLDWPKAETIKVSSLNIDHPLIYMANKCKERVVDGGDTNYHIFINSVDDIVAIILGAGLSPDNTKVVCASSEGSGKNNKEKLPEGFTIGKAGDPPKTINFYTSTCFEGCDILDEVGETIIVSDSLKRHTMMDISTSFIQIAGRIRNSKYKNKVTQIFSTSRYRMDLSAEEYERNTLETLDKVQGHID